MEFVNPSIYVCFRIRASLVTVLGVESANEEELADPPTDDVGAAVVVLEDDVDGVSVSEALCPEEGRLRRVALLQRVVLVLLHGRQQPRPGNLT